VSANTKIQILRSYANTSPAVLSDGELAYSFVSNTLFIGDNSGDIIQIGGPNYIANVTINLIDGGQF
jgi:hypothetical protein